MPLFLFQIRILNHERVSSLKVSSNSRSPSADAVWSCRVRLLGQFSFELNGSFAWFQMYIILVPVRQACRFTRNQRDTETNPFAYCSGKYQCVGIHHSVWFNSLDSNSGSDPALNSEKGLVPALRM